MSKIHTNKPGYHGKGSVEVNQSSQDGEGPIRRCALSLDKLVTNPADGVNTAYDVLAYSARIHGTRKALGWRDVIRIHEETKEVTKTVDGKEVKEQKLWKYYELSDYKYISYIEFQEIVSEVARGLVALGVSSDDIFNIYAQTSPTWQFIAHACSSISTTIATAYDTLGEEGLTHSLNEPNCAGIFTNAELLPTLLRVVGKTPSVRLVVYDGDASPSLITSIRDVREGLQVFSLDDLRAKGRAQSTDSLESRRPKPETVACIMYTSGSTGAPKGVVITHSNLVASIGAVYTLLGHHLTYDDTFLAYLPLAHMLEYIVELIMLFVGMTCGYGRVKTLTDPSVRNCKGDLNAFRPSIMVGVPAVWETIRKGILTKVNAGGPIKKTVFNAAMSAKRSSIIGLAQLADSVVLSGVRAATGGRLRLALCGGAALSKETQEFLSTALVTIVQGYGMTESCGMCAILPPELMQFSTVGLPVPSTEVKLRDVPDAGYLSTNNPQQGEVCIRGPSVVTGYYKRDDLNKDTTIFPGDGWLRTGDIGQWNKDGTLTLIDRLKNLVKLQNGEYIALERLESIYKACNLVANLCVHASPDANQPMAIIIPHEAQLRYYLETKGDSSLSKQANSCPFPDLCDNPAVQSIILRECNSLGKKNGFRNTEILQAVVLTPEEWTPENGLVTAAHKTQRGKIAKRFQKEIDAVYKRA